MSIEQIEREAERVYPQPIGNMDFDTNSIRRNAFTKGAQWASGRNGQGGLPSMEDCNGELQRLEIEFPETWVLPFIKFCQTPK